MRTMSGQRYIDDLIYKLGTLAAATPAILLTRLASWFLRMGVRMAARERSRLAFAAAQCLFQEFTYRAISARNFLFSRRSRAISSG